MIPLLHDFTGATVLVFGGGRVGARKARRFDREARVVVVSPEFADADFGDSERVRAAPAPGDADEWVERFDPALVVAATDDEAVNEAVERAARDAGTLVNRTDRHGSRDADSVVVPATVRDPPVVAAVATGGTSPALSKHLRQTIEAEIDGAGEMALLTADLREELQEEGVPPADRHEAVRAVVRSPRVWKGLRRGDSKGRQVARDVISNALDTGDAR
ncbi:bifunctional precorrin-2 dehydrogenase/sirohydrochlorin ferrochelatase [Halostella sp. JP-L12]|uniref:precorrin-2 dehydrogenase/sirohydrochlorin ferrochelatase family protein n=1 Tax=Halostella TaxID=1843185 RepID=UPI000EF79B97|nr:MULTISPECIES: bifunctional precorrin-2 dehydrogenase/sirohydrochlorin ferrochelatase [Halostella]NHN47108.1 bifunctional precorrin-2 dehydrogenase/sirohydrochlorin ferrochelatase [Halostella sp. JP-L12]